MPDGYKFKIVTSQTVGDADVFTGTFLPVNETDDPNIPSILLWMYNYFVYKIPGQAVVWNEQLVFEVKKTHVHHKPEWWAYATGFSISDQQDVTVIFKLDG